jgi:hypothetical protein
MPQTVPSQVVEFIDQVFPFAKNQKEGDGAQLASSHAPTLAAIVNLVNLIPGHLIDLSRSDYTTFVASLEAIRTSLGQWQSRGADHALKKVPGLGKLSPVTHLRRCLGKCPDELPSPGTPGLDFINDVALRDNLRGDLSAVNQALANGEWKAATVLSGSVIEALLLWAIQQQPSTNIDRAIANLRTTGDISIKATLKGASADSVERWNLSQYAEVASDLRLIRQETLNAVRLAKEFRNLIHPGKAKRLAMTADRGTALSSVGALEHVIRNLSK